MSASSLLPPSPTLPPTPQGRKRWTRDDCQFLENAGLLDDRYELIDGEIISKMGQNAPHSTAVMFVIAYLLLVFGRERVRTQTTMEVRDEDKITNRPEPDVLVLREAIKRKPTGADVLLAVEISDSTQSDDYGWKTTLYARAGVAEYWVLDLPRRLLVVFRRPSGDNWDERLEFTPADTVSCLAAPNHPVLVSDLLD